MDKENILEKARIRDCFFFVQFGGMYSQSDSKYRWRKVRGNLDLFVMERNERVSALEQHFN